MKSGVYQIRHLGSEKTYVGSSKTLGARFSVHRHSLKTNKHPNIKLQRAWNKYGADAFVFEVLLYCDPQDCVTYEQAAINRFKPEYNICQVAGNTLGRKLRASTKNKMKGPRPSVRGQKHPRSKLTDNQRDEIKQLGKQGLSQRKRAAMFGIGQATVYDIDHKW